MYYNFNKDKNEWLKRNRDISFEEIIELLKRDEIIDDIPNPSKNFPNQRGYVIDFNNYIYFVPFVREEPKIFLKTIIPMRKLNKRYKDEK